VAAALATLEAGPAAQSDAARSRLADFLHSESWEAKAKSFLSDVMVDL